MQGSNTGSGNDSPVGPFNAVDAFETLLNPPQDNQEQEAHKPEDEEGVVNLETSEEADESTGEESQEEESEQSEDEEGEQDEEAPRSYTVRVDGKEEQVSESELIAGYQRQADYTRKTQSLANVRKEVEQLKASTAQERSEYAALLPKLRQLVEMDLGPEPDWNALRKEDPVQALTLKDQWNEKKARILALRDEENRVQAQHQQEMAQHAQTVIREEAAKVAKVLPHWTKPEVAREEHGKIVNLLREVGFGEGETQIFDARAMHIAWMAMKYKELEAQKPALQKKIAKVPVAKPNGGTKKTTTVVQKAQQRLARSGSVKDAASVFEAFLE